MRHGVIRRGTVRCGAAYPAQSSKPNPTVSLIRSLSPAIPIQPSPSVHRPRFLNQVSYLSKLSTRNICTV